MVAVATGREATEAAGAIVAVAATGSDGDGATACVAEDDAAVAEAASGEFDVVTAGALGGRPSSAGSTRKGGNVTVAASALPTAPAVVANRAETAICKRRERDMLLSYCGPPLCDGNWLAE